MASTCEGSGKGTRVFFYTNIGSGIGGASSSMALATTAWATGPRTSVTRISRTGQPAHPAPGARSRTCARGGRSRGGCAPRVRARGIPPARDVRRQARNAALRHAGRSRPARGCLCPRRDREDRGLARHRPVERDHAVQPRMRRDRRRGREHGRRAARPCPAHGSREGVHIRRGPLPRSRSAPSATRWCPSVRSCTPPCTGVKSPVDIPLIPGRMSKSAAMLF